MTSAIQPLPKKPLPSFKTDTHFIYSHTKILGLAHAHNLGISQSSGELIAITDDDSEVPANWLDRIVAALGQNETVGMLFGNTLAMPHNAREGFVPVAGKLLKGLPYLLFPYR